MLIDNIIQILDDNSDRIKDSFGIDDNEMNNIKEFLNKEHENFKTIIDDMSKSSLGDRGKMTLCCLIGYVNGTTRTKLFESRKYENEDKEKSKKKTAR